MPDIITPGVIRGLNTSLTTIFDQELEAEAPSELFTRAVLETESNRKYVDYAWILAMGGGMREWIGEREVQEGAVLDRYMIQNRKFESTLRVEIEDIEDGTYAFKAQFQAAQRAGEYQRRKNDLLFDLMLGSLGTEADPSDPATWFQVGTGLVGPDGVPLLAVNHPRGHATKRVRANGTETYIYEQDSEFSNLTTMPFSKDALKAARTYLRKQKDHYGRPARLTPNVLVVGPNNEEAAREAVAPATIIRVETVDGVETRQQITNPMAGAFEVVVMDELGDSPAWFLLDLTKRIKPFIFQNRVRPQLQRTAPIQASAAEGLVDYTTFMQDAILYGIRARFGGGYGNPIYAFGSTGTGDALTGDALA
jgi:phage major head subunit gpT-like protein